MRVVICIDRKQLSSIAFKKRSDRFNRASNSPLKISQSFQKISIYFLESALINGLQANGTKKTMMVRLPTSVVAAGLFIVLLSSFRVPPIFFEQVKGWRHFYGRGWRLCGTRGRGFRPTSRAAEPRCARRGTRVRGSPGYEPGDRGPADKDRRIDPMCGKNSPA